MKSPAHQGALFDLSKSPVSAAHSLHALKGEPWTKPVDVVLQDAGSVHMAHGFESPQVALMSLMMSIVK